MLITNLEKLDVDNKSKKYKEICNRFNTNIENIDADDLEDEENADDLEDEENADDLEDEENADDLEDENKTKIDDIFIVDIDYIVNDETNKIYINQFVLQIIATQIGNKHAITYQRKVFDLQKFIQKYGSDACDALTNLYDKLDYYSSESERKNRCSAIIETSKIKKDTEITTLKREIENLLKHNTMIQTKIDLYEKLQHINS